MHIIQRQVIFLKLYDVMCPDCLKLNRAKITVHKWFTIGVGRGFHEILTTCDKVMGGSQKTCDVIHFG